jgi:hypothetical protein
MWHLHVLVEWYRTAKSGYLEQEYHFLVMKLLLSCPAISWPPALGTYFLLRYEHSFKNESVLTLNYLFINMC